jgi:hypothetical protein
VDYNDVKPGDVARKKKRTRRGAAKPKAETVAEVAPVVAAPVVAEAAVEAVEAVDAVDVETTVAPEAVAPDAVEGEAEEKKD